MFAELLEKVNEKEFADIFTPHSEEELEKRWPTYMVRFFSSNWNGDPTYEHGVKFQKDVSLKSDSSLGVVYKVFEQLGIDPARCRRDHMGMLPGRRMINLKAEDKVFGINNKPMVGWYGIRVSEIQEN